MNVPKKLGHYTTLGLKGLPMTNTLAYWPHLEVTKIMRCCEYGPGTVFTTLDFLHYL